MTDEQKKETQEKLRKVIDSIAQEKKKKLEEEMITGIRALAEMLHVYYEGLTENGFTEKQAIELCKDFVRMTQDKGKG